MTDGIIREQDEAEEEEADDEEVMRVLLFLDETARQHAHTMQHDAHNYQACRWRGNRILNSY